MREAESGVRGYIDMEEIKLAWALFWTVGSENTWVATIRTCVRACGELVVVIQIPLKSWNLASFPFHVAITEGSQFCLFVIPVSHSLDWPKGKFALFQSPEYKERALS
ncbi:hypothetical protein ACFX15_009596 [Malus domestica]